MHRKEAFFSGGSEKSFSRMLSHRIFGGLKAFLFNGFTAPFYSIPKPLMEIV